MENTSKIGIGFILILFFVIWYDRYQQSKGGTPIVDNLLPSDMEENPNPEASQIEGAGKYMIDEEIKGKTVSVGNVSLKIRELPSTSATIIATVSNKDLGKATGQIAYADGYNWIQIVKTIEDENGGFPIVKYGWLAKKYVKLSSVTPNYTTSGTVTNTVKAKTVSVGNVSLNIRTEPNTSAKIIATVSNQVLGQATGKTANTDGLNWVQIIKVTPVIGGVPITKIGWVASKYVTLS